LKTGLHHAVIAKNLRIPWNTLWRITGNEH
jgi:hypothetical protein